MGPSSRFLGYTCPVPLVPLQPMHSVLKPSVCVIAQGSKGVLLGKSRYRYDPVHYLLAPSSCPASVRC